MLGMDRAAGNPSICVGSGIPRSSCAVAFHVANAEILHAFCVGGKARLKGQQEGAGAMNMSTRNRIAFGAAVLLLSLGIARVASADRIEPQICDVDADYALGVEDYPEAIRLHAGLVRKHPDDALAHYHLGFAQGMIGNKTAEVSEYRRAATLGLKNWDLFLNLGLAQLENGDLNTATDSLRHAVLAGEDHPESHFNLGLVYELRGLHQDAEREMLESIRLNPRQPDARNLLGAIYVHEGNTAGAWLVWGELVRDVPDYEPARINLALLGSRNEVVVGETAAVVLPPAAAAKTVQDEPKIESKNRSK